MKPWTSAMTLIVAGAMLAGSAIAQTTMPSGEQKAKDTTSGAAGKSDTMKSGSMKGRGASTEQVKAVQQALKDKGHDPGTVDGKMGPKTQAALRDFQTKEGLKASGRLDADTMSKLGVEAKTGAAVGGSTTPSASPSGTGRSTGGASSGSSTGTTTK
jgi:peptidoglycan hydrolase-like protein with peptidoglycan-binding domain